MNLTLASIFLATALGGLVSVWLSATLAISLLRRLTPWLVSVAVGVMLTFAFADMLPEAIELGLAPDDAGYVLLLGLLAFFLLEKLALWRHAHGANANGRHAARVSLIVLGDGVHNFVDGVFIAATFLADPMLGWSATIAVVAHEIPQELSDFALLIESGLSRRRALLLNSLSGLAMVAGGIAGYVALGEMQALLPYAITLAAASFIYIAVADLVPALHAKTALRDGLTQSVMIVGGGAIVLASGLLH